MAQVEVRKNQKKTRGRGEHELAGLSRVQTAPSSLGSFVPRTWWGGILEPQKIAASLSENDIRQEQERPAAEPGLGLAREAMWMVIHAPVPFFDCPRYREFNKCPNVAGS